MNALIKECMKARRYEQALQHILQVRAGEPGDIVEYAAKQLQKIPPQVLQERIPLHKRLAVLGGATTQFVTPLIQLFACQRGVALSSYESGFGLFEQEIWADAPGLREFRPDVIHFQVSSHNLGWPLFSAEPAQLVQSQVERFATLYRTARERFQSVVIGDNFATAAERPYGTLDALQPGTRNGMIRALNAALAAALPAGVYLNDVEQLSSLLGKQRWADARLWNETKTAVSFECQPHYAERVAAMIGAAFGRSKKCLVLDLDNTLWGGVIGDDGLSGIRLGAGDAQGEAFQEFQRYLRALRERGVLLAVASKNEPENALAPFRGHADMILKESDIACLIAHWEPKDGSLRTIARQLNIGLDALVFFDDNPAERALIRRQLPQVTVVEVPEDPSEFVAALDGANLFDTLAVTAEDQSRGEFFQHDQAREQLADSAGSYDDFLRQLQMRAVVEPIGEANVARVTQLINKTNQFNLTTRRLTEAEVRALMSAQDSYTSTIRLDDRFGSSGLISVVIGRIAGATLHIDDWLMSCRVLKRGVELLEMERLLAFCRERKLREISGRYLPTAKNPLVSGHYASLGFEQIEGDAHGTSWRYRLEALRPLPPHFISVSEPA